MFYYSKFNLKNNKTPLIFNLDNSSAGIDRSTLGLNRRGHEPMAPTRRLKTGQGFSLFDLKDVISDVTETLSSALNKQGVDVSTDQLFLQLQNLVQNVGSANGYMDPGYSGVLSASDKVPYSVAGDMLVIAYEKYKNGDKKDALKDMLAAMGEDDFSAIANGIFLMNKSNNKNLLADDSDEDEDETTEDSDDNSNDSDDDDTDDTDEDDLEDSDIDDVLNDNEDYTASDYTSNDDSSTDSDNTDNDEEDSKDNASSETKPKPDKSAEDEDDKKRTPMGKTSSEMTASHTSKVLANRLSLDGSSASRARAKQFLKDNRNL